MMGDIEGSNLLIVPMIIKSMIRPDKQYCTSNQGCQVGLFEAKYDKFGLFLTVGLEIFLKLLSSWPLLSLGLFNGWPFFPKAYLVKCKIWPFFKT